MDFCTRIKQIPVSYTHLDVYKRQIHANAEGYELLAERRLKREGAAG